MTIDDLKETAALAHLNMDERELAAAFPAFEQMLGYFAAMQAADTEGAVPAEKNNPPASGVERAVSSGHFRGDAAVEHTAANPSHPLSEDLLDRAGERDGRFVVVPNVL
ncbi:MAG: aspartyl/glutamyl-tRNA amidotransferase subunit C [Spirochaetaceae bacterium]|jgi:aspartyl-tRNA(Asn)/glutamyl-tRNA(Gln) amidotransferase subunit C|nr:aspartyl/glutamyl-tRNA amidotransferase subunit C [Spirochaetaceae bacterium]